MSGKTLYERLGGYDAISAVANDLLPRLQADPRLRRFWDHRGEDGIAREKQLLVDFLCSSAGGPMYYTGRDMKTSHKGMRIGDGDWSAFLTHVEATLDRFQVPQRERDEVVAFIQSTRADIVEAQVMRMPRAVVLRASLMLCGPSALTTVTVLVSRGKPRSTCSGSHGFASSFSAMQ